MEYHLPGYNFCGPGTKLQERLDRGDKPINKLDGCCMVHDMVYTETTDTSKRVEADRKLRNCALAIIADPRTSASLRAEASIVSLAMLTQPGRWFK